MKFEVLFKNKKRAACLFFIILIALFSAGCHRDNKDIIKNAEQLNQSKYKINVDPGSAAVLLATEIFPNADIVYNKAISDAYLAVSQGKSDAFVYGKLFMQYAIKSESLDNLAIMDEVLAKIDIAVGISPKREDLLPKVNAFIKQIKEDGTFDDMYNRWVVDANTVMPDIALPQNPDMIIRAGTSGLIEPMNYFDKEQELTGFDLEFMYRLSAYMNAKFEIEAMSFDALTASLETGKLDLVVSDLNVTEEREQVILMSEPYMTSEIGIIVQKDRLADSSSKSKGKSDLNFIEGMKASFVRTFITENRWTVLLDGLLVTVWISLASLVLGTLLGFVFGFPLRSPNKSVRVISGAISAFLDGMPTVVILMVLYYIIFRDINISALWVGIIGFTLDFAKTVAGLLNTGVAAVDAGQIEAASSMGYNKYRIFTKIIFPQAAKQMFSQYEAAVIGLIKGTAIVGYITVEDLTKASDIIRSRTYEAFFPLIVTALLYFIIAYLFVGALHFIGTKLDPKRRPRLVKGVRTSDNH